MQYLLMAFVGCELPASHCGRYLALKAQPQRLIFEGGFYLSHSCCILSRMRKDPMSPIDNGTKVAMAFQRITDPERAKKEAQRQKEKEVAAKKAQAAAMPAKKPGAWGGLPSR